MHEWRTAPLSELADIRVSNVDKKSFSDEHAVRLCNYMDVYANDYIRAGIPFMEATATASEILKFRVECGDVLVTKDSETPDDIGIPSVVTDNIENLVCGYHLALIKPNRNLVDPVFLCKQLATRDTANYFSRYAAGSTRYGLSNGAIANTQIALAPLKQQQKIAAILTSIDTAIEKTEALIAKYQQIKTGLMHDLFTRGVLPNGQLRPPRDQAPELYQETPIGWIPKDWIVRRFGSSISIVDPNPSHRYPDEVAAGIPICSTENFSGDDDFDFSRSKLVPMSTYVDQNSRCQFKPNDVIFARKGRIGLARRYGVDPKVFSHTVVILKPQAGTIASPWLLWVARSNWFLGGIDRRMNSNSGVPTLGVDFIGNVLVPIPDRVEQTTAALRLDQASSVLSTQRDALRKLGAQKLGLMQDLLTGKVPVNVKESVAEPSDA